MVRAALASLMAGIVSLWTALAPPPLPASIRALAWTTEVHVLNQTVTIEAEFSNHCTVTSISERRHLWLTAAHCVMTDDLTAVEPHDYQIGTPAFGYTPAEVVLADGTVDLAILRTPALGVPALSMSPTPVRTGDAVQVIGHPFGFPESITTYGWVAHPGTAEGGLLDKPYLLVAVPIAPGDSGAAILNRRHQIVSVVQIGWGRSFSPVAGGAPWAVVRDFVHRVGL